ncbi:hypothetical protein [Candidatus Nitrosocosmicus sp. R]
MVNNNNISIGCWIIEGQTTIIMSKIINSRIQVSAEYDKNSIIIPIKGIIMRKELQT